MRCVCKTKRNKKSAERTHQNDAAEEEETVMTTEQMALVKKLIQKHEIEATDAEWTLIFLGVGYGLSEQQIDSYLVMNTTDLLAKHEKMLCILLGMDSEMQGAANEIQNPAERMQFMLENHFQRKNPESGYESVMQYVIEDSDLSAAQIGKLASVYRHLSGGQPDRTASESGRSRNAGRGHFRNGKEAKGCDGDTTMYRIL